MVTGNQVKNILEKKEVFYDHLMGVWRIFPTPTKENQELTPDKKKITIFRTPCFHCCFCTFE
jgi:hypothetical protein